MILAGFLNDEVIIVLHHDDYNSNKNRSDRDDYVTIDLRNVKDGKKRNFNKKDQSNNQGLPYDYG